VLARRLTITLALSLGVGALAAYIPTVGLIFLIVFIAFAAGLLVPVSNARSDVFWWMHPAWTVIIALTPGILLCLMLPSSYFLEHWGTPKFIDSSYILLIGGLLLAFIAGVHLGTRTVSPTKHRASIEDALTPETVMRLTRVTRTLFWITTLGYAVWALIGISRGLRPNDIIAIFTNGGVHTAKSFLHPVAGVTTLTQFGPLTAACLMLLRRAGSPVRVPRYLWTLFFLALVRTFVYAERLALIELAIPIIVIVLAFPRTQLRWKRALTLLPLWLPVGVLIFFGTFEYFRSYSSPYYKSKNAGHSYAYYTVTRLGAYYATALNNGVLLLHNDERRAAVPYYTLEGFWKFPILGSLLPYNQLAGTDVTEDFTTALQDQANPAFNNPSGILLPVFDLGTAGAFVFWFMAGGLIGWVFVMFRRRDIRGLLLYPVIFIGLWETGLILYWPTGRAFPSIIAALVIGARLRIQKRPAQALDSSVADAAIPLPAS
jgi:hypothetical protein